MEGKGDLATDVIRARLDTKPHAKSDDNDSVHTLLEGLLNNAEEVALGKSKFDVDRDVSSLRQYMYLSDGTRNNDKEQVREGCRCSRAALVPIFSRWPSFMRSAGMRTLLRRCVRDGIQAT